MQAEQDMTEAEDGDKPVATPDGFASVLFKDPVVPSSVLLDNPVTDLTHFNDAKYDPGQLMTVDTNMPQLEVASQLIAAGIVPGVDILWWAHLARVSACALRDSTEEGGGCHR